MHEGSMAFKRDFNVFVGSQTGVFKGLKCGESIAIEKNLSGLKVLPARDEITAIGWNDREEKNVLLGLVSQTVKVYDTELQTFTSSRNMNCGEGPIRGISGYNGLVLTAIESGEVQMWDDGRNERKGIIKTGPKLERMRHNTCDKEILAVGGEEADLSLWNLEAKEKCIFKAKNVPHNYLELRVPIWVSDIAFMPNSQKVATCSRHGHLRLYDPRAQRRPVINMEIPEQALTALAAASREHHVVVGSGRGDMMLVDLRGKGRTLNHYKGFAGGVRDIICHQTDPYIASVSLDRFFRLHHLDTKIQMHKVYMKSKLNCVLMRSDFSLKDEVKDISDSDSDVELVSNKEETKSTAAKEMDEIFSELDSNVLGKKSNESEMDSALKVKRKAITLPTAPKKKKKIKKSTMD